MKQYTFNEEELGILGAAMDGLAEANPKHKGIHMLKNKIYTALTEEVKDNRTKDMNINNMSKNELARYYNKLDPKQVAKWGGLKRVKKKCSTKDLKALILDIRKKANTLTKKPQEETSHAES